jgi:hypothetical protein
MEFSIYKQLATREERKKCIEFVRVGTILVNL